MSNININVTDSYIKYDLYNHVIKHKKQVDNTSIIIIFTYKLKLLYYNEFDEYDISYINTLSDILFYTNNNNYILIISRKQNYDLLNTNTSSINKLFFINDINDINTITNTTLSHVILYRKINKEYKLINKVSSESTIIYRHTIDIKIPTEINVLCILDEFTYNCFKPECKLHNLKPIIWKDQIINNKPDLFFVESVWNAIDSHLSLSNGKNDKLLEEIIRYCNYNNIPTIFWNKEDDINYNKFITTALLFNNILTTDERCIESYIKDSINHQNIRKIGCMEFACQPKIHNPLDEQGNIYNRHSDVMFAGRWYDDLLYRNEHIEKLIDIEEFHLNVYSIDIYDRQFETTPSFPSKYKKLIKCKQSYNEINTHLKRYKIMYNVNTITDSNTMFSRRIYEGLASGCCIISTYSKGIVNKFSDIILISYNTDDTKRHLDSLLINKLINTHQHTNQHTHQHTNNNIYTLSFKSHKRVIKTETYKNRFKQMLDMTQIKYNLFTDTMVCIIIYITDTDNIYRLWDFSDDMWEQSYKSIILNVFLDNSMDIDEFKTTYIDNINVLNGFMRIHPLSEESNINSKLMDMYKCKLSIYNTYDTEYIYDSILPFILIDIPELFGIILEPPDIESRLENNSFIKLFIFVIGFFVII